MFQVFINGLSTGLVLQLAIGPVFFFILNIAMQRTMLDGFSSVAAVTLVDYFYILLAVVGVGKLLENPRTKNILGMLSAVVLFIFGLIMLIALRGGLANPAAAAQSSSNYGASFLSAFLLTIASPLTIVFWTSLFTAKAIEYGYTKKQLVIFGVAAGLATVLFLGSAVVLFSIVKTSIPILLVQILNAVVGVVLMIYGVIRFVNALKAATTERGGAVNA